MNKDNELPTYARLEALESRVAPPPPYSASAVSNGSDGVLDTIEEQQEQDDQTDELLECMKFSELRELKTTKYKTNYWASWLLVWIRIIADVVIYLLDVFIAVVFAAHTTILYSDRSTPNIDALAWIYPVFTAVRFIMALAQFIVAMKAIGKDNIPDIIINNYARNWVVVKGGIRVHSLLKCMEPNTTEYALARFCQFEFGSFWDYLAALPLRVVSIYYTVIVIANQLARFRSASVVFSYVLYVYPMTGALMVCLLVAAALYGLQLLGFLAALFVFTFNTVWVMNRELKTLRPLLRYWITKTAIKY